MTDPTVDKRLFEVKRRLLFDRRWAYLRYLHLREGFTIADELETVLCVGAGRAIAEVGLAVEFPNTHFLITDIRSSRTPNYSQAQDLASAWNLKNVTFEVLDVMAPHSGLRFDLVCSVEVLEHIEDDREAVRNMYALSKKYVYALVPYADKHSQQDLDLTRRAWDRHEHFRVGYDTKDLSLLFPNQIESRGCYWRNAGQVFRSKLQDSDMEVVLANVDEWAERAQEDIQMQTPHLSSQAQGIWVLASSSPQEEGGSK